MSELVAYERRPEDLQEPFASTVDANMKIFGKSMKTMLLTILLLKLPDEIQTENIISRRDAEKKHFFAARFARQRRTKDGRNY